MTYLWVVVLLLSALLTIRFVWSFLDDFGYKMGGKHRSLEILYGVCLTGWWCFWISVAFG